MFSAEGAAGAGEDQTADLAAIRAALQALKNGGMLAVDGNDIRAIFAGRRHHQLSGAHKSFLVGQRNAPTQTDGGQRWLQPHAAHHGGDHGVRLCRLRGSQQTIWPGQHLDIRAVQAAAQLGSRALVIKHGKARAKFPRLRFQQIHAVMRRQRGHMQLQFPGHGQRLPADGPRTSQQGDDFCHARSLNTGRRSG